MMNVRLPIHERMHRHMKSGCGENGLRSDTPVEVMHETLSKKASVRLSSPESKNGNIPIIANRGHMVTITPAASTSVNFSGGLRPIRESASPMVMVIMMEAKMPGSEVDMR